MDLTFFQVLAAAVCLAVALIGLALPALLRHSASALSIGNCLAAGCILGGGLLHLLPDAAESLADVGGDYPTGHLVFSLGLLLPIVIEQLAASYVASHKQRRPLLRASTAPQRASYEAPAAAEAPCEHDHGHAEAHGQAHAHGEGGDCCEHEHEHGHGHDHRDSSENSDAPPHDHHDVTDGGRLPLSSAMVLLLALSFHSFLEGLGMGSAESHDDTLSLLLLIALHKGLAAFALGMSFLGAGLGRRATVVLGGTFALATPIGVAFGVLLRSSAENSTPSAVCVAAAAGSFVYVALVEVLPRELAHRAARRRTLLAALLSGFAIFAALAVWL